MIHFNLAYSLNSVYFKHSYETYFMKFYVSFLKDTYDMTTPTENDWVIKLSDFLIKKKSLFSSDLILSANTERLFVALKNAKIENEWASDGPIYNPVETNTNDWLVFSETLPLRFFLININILINLSVF